MRQATLARLLQGDTGTFGVFTLDDGWECKTAELPWRDNKKGVSCILAGEYEVKRDWSPKRGKYVYELQDVPGRGDIQIHTGNWAGDKKKGLRSDVEGCILLGLDVGEVLGQMGVMGSRKALEEFERRLSGERFVLQILNRIKEEVVT